MQTRRFDQGPSLGRRFLRKTDMYDALLALFYESLRPKAPVCRTVAERLAATMSAEDMRELYVACPVRAINVANRAHLVVCLRVGDFPSYFTRMVLGMVDVYRRLDDVVRARLEDLDDKYCRVSVYMQREKLGVVDTLKLMRDMLLTVESGLVKSANVPRRMIAHDSELSEAFLINEVDGSFFQWYDVKIGRQGHLFQRVATRDVRVNGSELLRGPFVETFFPSAPLARAMIRDMAEGTGVADFCASVGGILGRLEACTNARDPSFVCSREVLDRLVGQQSLYARRMAPEFVLDPMPLEQGDVLRLVFQKLGGPVTVRIEQHIGSELANDGVYRVSIQGVTYCMKVGVGHSTVRLGEMADIFGRIEQWGEAADTAGLVRFRDACMLNAVTGEPMTFFVYDWVHGETVASVLGRRDCYSRSRLVDYTWLYQILRSLYTLHANGIRHCAVRAENIMITEGGKQAVLISLDSAVLDSEMPDRGARHEETCDRYEGSTVFERLAPSMRRHKPARSNPLLEEVLQVYRALGILPKNLQRLAAMLPRWSKQKNGIPVCYCRCMSDARWDSVHLLLTQVTPPPKASASWLVIDEPSPYCPDVSPEPRATSPLSPEDFDIVGPNESFEDIFDGLADFPVDRDELHRLEAAIDRVTQIN